MPVPCRALTVLCAAAGAEVLAELKTAAVAADWELVGGAASLEELERQLATWEPNVILIDASLGSEAVRMARRSHPGARVVSVGSIEGADAMAGSLEEVRAAILGIPQSGGPTPS